jgi:hypothetical protein
LVRGSRAEVPGGNITEEREKFAHVAGALPNRLFQRMMDLVDNEPENAYTVLKGRMVLAHELTPVQKAAKVLQLPSLGNQRPSELMASLMQFCPPGETGTAMFRASFISRLPSSLQIHLSGTEMGDLRELTQQADRLWLCHGPQPVAAVSIQQEELRSQRRPWQPSRGRGRAPLARRERAPLPSRADSRRRAREAGVAERRPERRAREEASRRPAPAASGCASSTPGWLHGHFCEDEERCTFSGN